MKALVVSDSHKDLGNLQNLLKRIHSDISYLLHLGDCHNDLDTIKPAYPNVRFEAVRGNCDYGGAPTETMLKIMGKKIFMTHGHLYNVKTDYGWIIEKAREKSADICLFGHTHIPIIFERGKTIFLNPGSISLPHYNFKHISYGIIHITEEGEIRTSIVAKQNGVFRPVDRMDKFVDY